MRVVVTGASRGIGLEFVRQLLKRGDVVDAAVRDPETAKHLQGLASLRLKIGRCDVAKAESIAAYVATLGAEPVDWLINNAGIIGDKAESFADFDANIADEVYRTNTLGPVLMTKALLPLLRRAKAPKVVSITSGLASIADASSGYLSYRLSKVALNMAMKVLAGEEPKLVSLSLSPGWVQTDMGGSGASLSVDESVRRMLGVIERVTLKESGQFWSQGDRTIPY